MMTGKGWNLLCLLLMAIPTGCGGSAGGEDGGEDEVEADSDAEDEDMGIGCVADDQCDDGIACTRDLCRDGDCMHFADHAQCEQDEYCRLGEGCSPSGACTDDSDCVIDDPCSTAVCDGPTRTCRYSTMDGDGDLDPPRICGGTDCDDTDPFIHGNADEVCNGVDDNCDGGADENFECIRGSSVECDACGVTGSRTCTESCSWNPCIPSAPELAECAPADERPCVSPCGIETTEVCTDACRWPGCVSPETCNGVDDDCNGAIDDGFECVLGTVVDCFAPCGSIGSSVCNESCGLGECTPPEEVCDGMDNDCDGSPDETFECVRNEVRSCTTACGLDGTQLCRLCAWDECCAPEDVCGNGCDDNCNGWTDEDFHEHTVRSLASGYAAHIARSDSGFGVVYRRQNGTSYEMRFAVLDSDGNTLSTLVLDTDTGRWVDPPRVVYSGEFAVMWKSDLAGDRGVMFARIDAAGSLVAPAVELIESASAFDIAWSGSRYGVVWTDNADGSPDMFLTVRDETGAQVSGGLWITDTAEYVYCDNIVWGGSEWGVAWTDSRDGTPDAYFSEASSDGSVAGPNIQVSDGTGVVRGGTENKVVNLLYTGSEYIVKWEDDRSGRDEIYFARLGLDGTKIGGDISVPESAFAYGSSIAFSGSELAVTWEGDTSIYDHDTLLQRFSLAGDPIGAAISIYINEGITNAIFADPDYAVIIAQPAVSPGVMQFVLVGCH